MHDEPEITGTVTSASQVIVTFVLLLLIFSSVAYALTIRLHHQTPMLSRLMMWCPGAAALATGALHHLPRTTLGWRWPQRRWLVFAYIVPILYALPVYVLTWFCVTDSLAPASYLAATAADYGFVGSPALATVFVGIPLLATAGMIGGVTWALGEELGWRGLLMPWLGETWGFNLTCLASGLLWSAWHYPVLLWADYNAGTNSTYAIVCFTCSVTGMAFILGWLRLMSGSVWPCAVLHASHNTFIQGVLDPMTGNANGSRLVTTEFGFGLTLTVWIVVFILLNRYPASRGSIASA